VAQTSEASLPRLGKDGDLPPGSYRITLKETLRRFGKGSRQRVAVAQRLERIYGVALGTSQLARFVVFGSFVSWQIKRDGTPRGIIEIVEEPA